MIYFENWKKRGDELTIEIINNGFIVSCSGRDNDDDWISSKVFCKDLDEVMLVMKEFQSLPKD